MNKSIEYYMTLNYEVKTEKIPTEEGGGWTAWIPLLGEYFCVGDGDTEEEAIKDLMKWRAECFKILIQQGIHIPEPGGKNLEDN
jgi:predicted RNase H-like HicB family nuclease